MSQEQTLITKRCKACSAIFDITPEDLNFLDKVSPVFAGVKYPIPPTDLCPTCSVQRRLAFRNERNLYKRNCDATGKNIVSMFSPDKPHKVYEQSEWWSDKWDPKEYAKDYDFSRSFFEQFDELLKTVPNGALAVQESENSEYTNYAIGNKNCYLTFGGDYSEDCMYGNFQFYSKNCIDFYWMIKSENCYEVINCTDCTKTFYSKDSKNLADCYFCFNCKSCTNCIGCTNLSNKKYYIFNKESTKEEYDNMISKLGDYKNLKELKEKIYDFFSKQTFKSVDITLSENSNGDMIKTSKNCTNCFSIENGEDCKDLYLCIGIKDVRNSTLVGFGSSNVYNTLGVEGGVNLNFVAYSWGNNRDMFYSFQCHNNCSNLFGCFGLRNSAYCILNKQYTKEEYEELVPKIINHMNENGEWGEFFPASISPFGYNESVSNEYWPLSKEEAKKLGFNWSDYENPRPEVTKIIPASKLPSDISQIPDDITNWAIECEVTGRPFRILKTELEFYRKHSLPIPHKHPDERHLDRMKLRNPMKLYDRKCDKCNTEIKTTYSPDRTEMIYCEECFNKEFV